ncbi:MAG: metallophosphoesterase [Chloroflexota bacterium]
MIRLLHTADVHLGRQFPALRNKGSEYRFQLLRTFEKITDLAESERVSLLLIAGDLFNTNHIFGVTIGRVLAAFRKLENSGVRVCILPGTHDAYTEDSIYRSVRFPPNVTVFTPEHSQQTYEDLDLTVYGRVPDGSRGESPLRGLKLSEKTKFHVGMAHCSLRRADIAGSEDMLLDMSELAGSGLDYLALGHWHSFQDLSQGNTRACYSGSPEPVDRDQKGAGNVVMVKLHQKNSLEITPIRIGTKRIDSLTIDVSPLESPESIVSLIEARADPHLILEVTLTGLRGMGYDLNPQELENGLGGRFFNLRVLDSSHPKLEEVKAQNFPEKTVTGRFLRMVEEKIARASTEEEKSLYEEVLKLGFALLQGRGQVLE